MRQLRPLIFRQPISSGAYIAQVDESGDVGDGVSIDADTLTATNIEGYDHANSEEGIGRCRYQRGSEWCAGDTASVGVQSSGHEKEQLVKATIGDGDINVDQTVVVTNDSSQMGVNRDMDQLNQITKDEVQESIDVELDIDVSYITNPISSVADDVDAVVNLPGNAVQAVTNVAEAGVDLMTSVTDTITGDSPDGIIDTYESKTRNQELALQTNIDSDLDSALSNIAENPEAAEAALEALAKQALEANGLGDEDVDIVIYDSNDMTDEQKEALVMGKAAGKDEMDAFYDPKTGVIYMNAATMNGSNGQLVSTLANELSHYVDAKNGHEFNQERQDYSTKNEKDALAEFVQCLKIWMATDR